jgi:hypothetical protein
MPRHTATPQITQDHMLGSGALTFSWWRSADIQGMDTPDWQTVITCENGDGGETTTTVTHAVVMAAARKVLASRPQYASDAFVRECRNLGDEADFDACTADELLQFIVLGAIVFG